MRSRFPFALLLTARAVADELQHMGYQAEAVDYSVFTTAPELIVRPFMLSQLQ